jgi:hypothetical protein
MSDLAFSFLLTAGLTVPLAVGLLIVDAKIRRLERRLDMLGLTETRAQYTKAIQTTGQMQNPYQGSDHA